MDKEMTSLVVGTDDTNQSLLSLPHKTMTHSSGRSLLIASGKRIFATSHHNDLGRALLDFFRCASLRKENQSVATAKHTKPKVSDTILCVS